MLDIFLELIDRAIQLIEKKNQRTVAAVTKLVDPIQTELRTIHQDYLEMFDRAAFTLNNGNNKKVRAVLREIITELYADRVKRQAARKEIYILSKRLRELDLNYSVIEYFVSVQEYFPTTALEYRENRGTFASSATGLITDLHKLEGGAMLQDDGDVGYVRKIGPEHVQKLIDEYVGVKNKQWENVCEKYAAVKALEASF